MDTKWSDDEDDVDVDVDVVDVVGCLVCCFMILLNISIVNDLPAFCTFLLFMSDVKSIANDVNEGGRSRGYGAN